MEDLLLLARCGKQEQPDAILAMVSRETLIGIIRTTRTRVNFFMNKFRKLGLIEYNGKIKINKSLVDGGAARVGMRRARTSRLPATS